MAFLTSILQRWLRPALQWSVLVAVAAAGAFASRHAPDPGALDGTTAAAALPIGATADLQFEAGLDAGMDVDVDVVGDLAVDVVGSSDRALDSNTGSSADRGADAAPGCGTDGEPTAGSARRQDARPAVAANRPNRTDRSVEGPSARELSGLRRAPSHAVDRPFRVTVTVHRVGAEWNAYFTRFVPHSHLRLEVWSDDQFPWRSQDFAAPAPYVFVPRGTPLEAAAAALAPYDRVVVEGVVRQVFAGEPWIELSAIEPADVSLTEATVFHAARAIALAGRGLQGLACSELDHALAAPMPQRHRDELVRLRASYAAPVAER